MQNYLSLQAKLKSKKKSETALGKKGTCIFNQKGFHRNVSNFIRKSGKDFSTVEDPHFRKIFDGKY